MFEKLKLSFHKIRVFVLDKVNSAKFFILDPMEMEGNEMTEELFHVEYEDGDEEDMDTQEVTEAIALAAARRGAG